jgi:multidrug efflux pump subunit AcrA (membrane-fusion protein)
VPESPQRSLRRTWMRRAIPAGAVAILVVGGTAMVRANASANPIDTYRTTTVTTGSVEQRLDLTGSVQRVNQVSQSFAVSGTVSSVSVAVGDKVGSGQTLATLDTRPLNTAVTAAEADLAQAKATLESDQTPTTTTTTTTAATNVAPAQTATPTTSPRAAGSSGRSGSGANQSLAAAQQRVTRAQSAVAADLARATAALTQCASFFPSGPSPSAAAGTPTTPVPTTTGAPGTPSAGPTATSTLTQTPTEAEITACLGALRTAPTQLQIQRDQQALTSGQADLTKAITLALTTAANSATTSSTTSRSTSTSQSGGSSSSATQSSTSRSSGAQTGSTGQSGAARVVSDQAAVTNADSALSLARANMASATLKSSIAGTVGSVTLASNASSQGKSIVIVGAGAVELTVNVPLASMAGVHMGQKANVTPQGATTSVPGTVTSISLLPSAATTGSGTGATQATAAASNPTYPVVILVPDALPALASGSHAQASLLVGTVADALTVPNSVLTPLGNGQAAVLTLNRGVATRSLVRTGYAGMLTTQITSGLTKGQQVVIADLSTALPANTTNLRRFGVGGAAAGGLGGAGLGGAGLGGGGLGGGGLGGAGLGGGTITGPSGFTPGG